MNRTAAELTTSDTGQAWPFNMRQRMTLSDDPTERVRQTATAMAAMIHHAAAVGPQVAYLSNTILSSGAQQPNARSLWEMLKRRQERTDDPAGVELLRHPEQSAFDINNGGAFLGDCDDVAMLAAALAIRMGFGAVELVIIARTGREWEHVYVRVGHSSPMWTIDPQETDVPLTEREHAAELVFPVWRS